MKKIIWFAAITLSLPTGVFLAIYGQDLSVNATSQCDNSAATSEYNACKSSAAQEKNSCIKDCQFYREDPCYGECESNYNQCSGECNATYDAATSTCSDIFAESSCLNDDNGSTDKDGIDDNSDSDKTDQPPANKCSDQNKKLEAAHKKVAEACKGIAYPERLLTSQGRERNDLQGPLCESLKKQLDDAQATVDRTEKHLADDKSEKSFQKTILQNQEIGYANLLDEYENLQKDIEEKKAKFDEASEKFTEIKNESNQAWIEAIAGTGGPAGAMVDIGLALGKGFGGQDSTHIGVRTGIDVAEYAADYGLEKFFETELKGLGLEKFPKGTKSMGELSPLAFVGIAYDGLELQHLKNKTHEIEKEYNQVRGWYEDALTAMNGFKNSRQDYAKLMDLESKREATKQKIRLLEIGIEAFEKQIPVMKHTLSIAKELYEKCVKDKKEEDQTLEQQERCRKALQEEQSAKNENDICQGK